MSTRHAAPLLLIAIAGCGVDATDPAGADQPTHAVTSKELRVSPAAFSARVVGDTTVDGAFTATLVSPDGTEQDVTDKVTWSLADARFGQVRANHLTVTGEGAGATELRADLDGIAGSSHVVVYVEGVRNEGVPLGTPAMFAAALAKDGCAPRLAYPENNTVVPANLGTLDVHWTDDANELFAVHVQNLYVDLTYYTPGPGYTQIESDWSKLATSRAPVTIQVTGMTAAHPTAKCVGAARVVQLTADEASGGVYYWSTNWLARAAGSAGQDIVRYDLGKPDVAPAPMFTDANRPAACVGCHALSRDGKRIAMTLDGTGGRGAVIDLATNRQMMPTDGTAPLWSTAVFNHDGSKLVAVHDGQMSLLVADGGRVITTIPSSPGTIAGNPELSPDGTKLVNVETTGSDDWAFPTAQIVVRGFDNAKNVFGAAKVVLPFDAGDGMQSYYPSWSPDGRWLAVTRAPNGNSYDNPEASIWIIDANGEVPPVELAGSQGAMDSWARWMPAANTIGGEKLFFLSFSSTRAFGTRLPEGGLPQIWVQPFFPERAIASSNATAPAYRAPFQSITASNHNAQWTTAVVSAN